MRLLLHDRVPLPLCLWFISFCHQNCVVALLAHVGRVGFLTLLYHNRRKLQETADFSLH